MDKFVNLRATMLDDASWFVPFIETCTKEKLSVGDHPRSTQLKRKRSLQWRNMRF